MNSSEHIVRLHDRDRFLAGILMPMPVRPDLWALFAFNHEIAKIRETVSQPTLGLIRLQWWRDALDKIYNGEDAPAHDVARDLADTIRRHELPHHEFENLLAARERDLDDKPMESIEALATYAGSVNAPLLRMASLIAGEDSDAALVATAYGLAGIIRSVPFLARQGRCLLQVNVNDPVALKDIVRDVCRYAEALLRQAKPTGRMERVTARQALLLLGHIRALDYDVRDSRLNLPPPFYVLRVALFSLSRWGERRKDYSPFSLGM